MQAGDGYQRHSKRRKYTTRKDNAAAEVGGCVLLLIVEETGTHITGQINMRRVRASNRQWCVTEKFSLHHEQCAWLEQVKKEDNNFAQKTIEFTIIVILSRQKGTKVKR